MTDVKTPSSIAPLKNVTAFMTMIDRLQNRGTGTPGFGVFHGWSGIGKTNCANFAVNALHPSVVYLEVGSTWGRRDFLRKLLVELNEPFKKGENITDLLDKVLDVLGGDPDLVLMFDEADRLLKHDMIEIVRDIHDQLQVAVVLLGEEQLPKKLGAFERVQRRVSDWTAAQPCDLEDAHHLRRLVVPELEITDGLLGDIVTETKGNAGRIATTLYRVLDEARNTGVLLMDQATYRGPIHTSQIPTRYSQKKQAAA